MIGEFLFNLAIANGLNPGQAWVELLFGTLLLLEIAGRWRVLNKAGEQGWSQFIPIWSDIALLNVAELPATWIIGLCLPGISYIVGIMIGLAIARNFEKGILFGLGLAFLPGIFYPILGFSKDEWGGPGGYHGMG